MPIQQDNANPQKVVDFTGKPLTSEGQTAVKTVDVYGRTAEEAPAVEKPAASPEEAKQEDIKTSTEAEARKLFLQAQKAERKAKEAQKKAEAGLKKSEAIEAAIELASSGKDPTALLKAAGVDPIKFYRDMTDFALREPEKTEDPTQKELREHKERIEKYEAENKKLAEQIESDKQIAAHNKTITEQVIPLLQNNADKYESLITEYGKNAALEVYKAVWEAYQLPDEQKPAGWKMPTFEEAADRMEEYWSNQIESGLIAASKLKKFQNRFAQGNGTTSNNKDQSETPNRSFTLSNKHIASPPPSKQKYMTRDERIADIVKRNS